MEHPEYIRVRREIDAYDDGRIPYYMIEGIKNHILDGIPTGDFLTAVFENKLMEAFMKADHLNQRAMREYAALLYNVAPKGCYGSPENVIAWIENSGLRGIYSKSENSSQDDEDGGVEDDEIEVDDGGTEPEFDDGGEA